MIDKNSRVVVIDDVEDEVRPLLKYLNKEGVHYNYYSGAKRFLPRQPLRGTRLIFLDFVLGTGGQPDKSKLATLIGVLKEVIDPENGPYIILAWTTHNKPADDLLGMFKTEIFRTRTIPLPIAVIDTDKSACLKNPSSIAMKIKNGLGAVPEYRFLFGWENNARDALLDILQVIQKLSADASSNATDLNNRTTILSSELRNRFHWFAESQLGKNLGTPRETVTAVETTLTTLFQGQLEQNVRQHPSGTLEFGRLVAKPGQTLNSEECSKMNAAFLTVQGRLNNASQPGNIYRFSDIWSAISQSGPQLTATKVIRAFCQNPRTIERSMGKLKKECIPVFMEISAVCDFAQKTWQTNKLVLGVLWPTDPRNAKGIDKKMKNRADFLYPRLPISFENLSYFMTFHSRYLYTPRVSVLKKLNPIMRARSEFLTDVQHWLAGHISRPGKVVFTVQ